MFQSFYQFVGFRPFGAPGKTMITQPIVLTNADGVVFVNELGQVLTRGYKRVKPLKEPSQ